MGLQQDAHGGHSGKLDIAGFQEEKSLLLQPCDFVAPLVLHLRTSIRKVNLSGLIFEIPNIFVLLQTSTIRGVRSVNISDFNPTSSLHQCDVYTVDQGPVYISVTCTRWIRVQFTSV